MPSENSSSISVWTYFLNFYQITVSLAFFLTIAILILTRGGRVWSVINRNFIPPYQVPTLDNNLPVSQQQENYSLFRSAKLAIIFFLVTVSLAFLMITSEVRWQLMYSDTFTTYIRQASDHFFATLLLDTIQFPLSSFETIGMDGSTDAALSINILHIWIPSIPLAIFFINVYEILSRRIRQALFILVDSTLFR